MKKTLFTSMILLLGSYVSFSQEAVQLEDSPFIPSTRPVGTPISDPQFRAAPFWTEDFANGFPASWTIIDTSGICPWTYSTDGSWGNFNGNNATAAAAGISSTTAANGFLIMDADSANHFTYGQPSGANYQYLSSYFQTSAIDCSTRPSVILSFQQSFRYNNGVSMNVQVSSDGVNWTNFNVSNGQANNAASVNPMLVSLNISTIAANQPTVYIRIGWSARVYYWMIDDLALSEADANDVLMADSWWGMNSFNYQYYKIPISQAAPITFSSELVNYTGGTLNGCAADIDVSGTSGSVYTGTTNGLSLAGGETDTVSSTTTWTPSQIGFYDLTFTATTSSGTDENLSNNEFTDSISITSDIFGLDNLTSASQSTGSISNWSSNTGGAFKIGNVYQITNDDSFCEMEIGLANNTNTVGRDFFGEVYKYDPSSGDWVFLESTDFYSITAADIGTIQTIPLLGEVEVLAGEEILVVACHNGGVVSGAEDVSFMYGQGVANQMVWGFNATNSPLWLSNPRAIVVRAKFNCGLGIDEKAEKIDVEAFPNPANSELTINVNSGNATSGIILMHDLSGKLISENTFSTNDGTYTLNINTSDLSNGMYTLSVETENGTTKQKVHVLH